MNIDNDDRKSFSGWMENANRDNNSGCAIGFFIFCLLIIFPPILFLWGMAHDASTKNSASEFADISLTISGAIFLAIFLYILIRKSKSN